MPNDKVYKTELPTSVKTVSSVVMSISVDLQDTNMIIAQQFRFMFFCTDFRARLCSAAEFVHSVLYCHSVLRAIIFIIAIAHPPLLFTENTPRSLTAL